MKRVKGFVTYKCGNCNNMMRDEYNHRCKNRPCRVCGSEQWIKITMDERK